MSDESKAGKFITWEEWQALTAWSTLPDGIPATPLTKAAPKLLEACKEAASLLSYWVPGLAYCRKRIQDAIQEAEGREAP